MTSESPKLRLYYRPHTRASRIRWMLEESGLPYELVTQTVEESRGAEHRQRQPLGRVPVLEIDGRCVFESAALCLVVADLAPAAGLIPPVGSIERALAYQWTVFAVTEIEPHVGAVAHNRDEHPELAKAATERVGDALAAVEDALAGHEWLVGERFGAVDVAAASVLGFAEFVGLTADHANINAYVKRTRERPAFARAQD